MSLNNKMSSTTSISAERVLKEKILFDENNFGYWKKKLTAVFSAIQFMVVLENEEKEFIRQLILASGSLKELAKVYDVSYPTVRLRLDRVINKVKLYSDQENNPFVNSIMQMVIEDKISLDSANEIIKKYKKEV